MLTIALNANIVSLESHCNYVSNDNCMSLITKKLTTYP